MIYIQVGLETAATNYVMGWPLQIVTFGYQLFVGTVPHFLRVQLSLASVLRFLSSNLFCRPLYPTPFLWGGGVVRGGKGLER